MGPPRCYRANVEGYRRMCGIVGLYLKNPSLQADLGRSVVAMLGEMRERGPDSSGIAIYRQPAPEGYEKITLQTADPAPDWPGLSDEIAVALGAVAAAVMSSIDSSILSASTMFSWNIYRPLLRPRATPREVRRVTRVVVVLIGAAAALLALTVQSVYVLWYLCADVVYVVLFPQLTLVLFFRRAHRWAAFVGVVVGVLLRLGGGEQSLGLDAWIPYPMEGDFPFRTVAMLANLGITWCLSLLLTRSEEGKRVP